MGSQQKQTQLERKAQYERKLEKRIAYLTAEGVGSPRIDKDAFVKKLKADIKAVNTRLGAIAAKEKRTEELARAKAEKKAAAAAPPAPKEKKAEKEGGKKPAKEKAPAEAKAKGEAKVKEEKPKKEKPKKEAKPESEPAS